MISEQLRLIKQQIADAAKASGRDPAEVRLVSVSKQIAVDKIREALAAGADLLGENKIQEARDKIAELGRDCAQWHFIGHLQKNKVKYLFDLFHMVHSVDSLELARAISDKAVQRNTLMPILLQVNVSGELSKFGMAPEELPKVLEAVAEFKGIQVKGLMTIPPAAPDPEASRPYFARLRELRDKYATIADTISLTELSMGMTNDFAVAVEEGATLVRVGTAIFGERNATV
ncbi:MAG: YggS family pyridoxal phosphate-dependent enzyme [Candidatus Nitrohelix vancouverensis]|uniref:Pyridoxal phosphate homeostasis protein n=1 Tax=Candidatus Nitrohelix vancouverensis TaxID=2705534 RepID=A0A7T0C4V4_9BACT|nr:MAG: YggS family pyridoxal phosphate-dependent enzyme [Candidatus Nitrohelix vancouverensis]